ncbi:MAG: Rrf2 family transcriptional regulator [Porphyromonadaceae bacterium]|nr:MAG: Rrf2 family transcriptional regulator [Porphyromonadaceae bacterium]
MDLSKTSQYALRVLGFMALDESALYISEQISTVLNIPPQYLRRLLTNLSKAGLLNSDKGKGGGFKLAKTAGSIYIIDILAATEKKELLNSCIFGLENCIRDNPCAMHEQWAEARENILKILRTTSLADMIKNPPDKGSYEISNQQ